MYTKQVFISVKPTHKISYSSSDIRFVSNYKYTISDKVNIRQSWRSLAFVAVMIKTSDQVELTQLNAFCFCLKIKNVHT